MPTMTIEVANLPDFDGLQTAFQQAGTDALTVITEMVAGIAQVNSPVDRGFFRAGITPSVQSNGPLVLEGRVGTNGVQYASVIEEVDPATGQSVLYGRSPGSKFPPIDLIEEWIERKGIGLDLQETARAGVFSRFGKDAVSGRIADVAASSALRGLAFVIARAIATRGLARSGDDQFRPITRATQQCAEQINQILTDDLAARIKELMNA